MAKGKPIKSVKNRNDKGQFGPGNNANPNGRPPSGTALSDLLRGKLSGKLADLFPDKFATDKRTVNEAIADAVVKEVLLGRDPIKAAALVFDRLEGKPSQSIALKHSGGIPVYTGDIPAEEYLENAISNHKD